MTSVAGPAPRAGAVWPLRPPRSRSCALPSSLQPLQSRRRPSRRSGAAPAPSPTFSKDECAVWAREQAFADSVKAHDAKAFVDFVSTGAVFGVGSGAPGARPRGDREGLGGHHRRLGARVVVVSHRRRHRRRTRHRVLDRSGPARIARRQDAQSASRSPPSYPPGIATATAHGACCSTAAPCPGPPATPMSPTSTPAARPVRRPEG